MPRTTSAGAEVEHEKEIEIRWRDLDVYGHVNHVVFLTYLEEARDEWLGSTLGDPARVWGYVVARVEIDYRRELSLADDVVAGALPARADRDVERRHAGAFWRPGRGEVAAEAEAVLVARDAGDRPVASAPTTSAPRSSARD